MPLSEQEQRLLDEMERSLYHSDGDDVATVGRRRGRANYTAIALGALGIVLGLALLLVGVVTRLPIVGILGFALMFAGALFAITPPRRFTVPRAPKVGRRGLMDAVNERWERRNDVDGES